MATALEMKARGIAVSPVDIEDRANLGIEPGDTVRVWVKVEEKGKTRTQPFEGIVMACKHGREPGATFSVRRVSGGYTVEKVFPLYSPVIDKIEILKRTKTRRAKLYYIREKAARQLRKHLRALKFEGKTTAAEKSDASTTEADAPEQLTEQKAEPEVKNETPTPETPAEEKEEKTD